SAPLRDVFIFPPLNHDNLDNGPLLIPANTTRTFTAHYPVPVNVSLLAVGPHMHLIGRRIESFAVTPAHDTLPFVNIPSWNFHWQGLYEFPKLLKVPVGSTLYSS